MRRWWCCVSAFTVVLATLVILRPCMAEGSRHDTTGFFASLRMTSISQIKSHFRPSDIRILDRHQTLLNTHRTESGYRRLHWITLAEISPALSATTITAEDKRFYDHGGVDGWALLGSLIHGLTFQGFRGASTISMQLAALLDPNISPLQKKKHRSLSQKWDQMQAAWDLESQWTKAEILEAYFNLVTFRGELQGIGAAASLLLQKQPSGITESEAIILTSLLRSPNAKLSHIQKRACHLATSINASVTCPTVEALAHTMLDVQTGKTKKTMPSLAPFVAKFLPPAYPKSTWVTTLDASTQTFAKDTLARHLLTLSDQHVSDGAILVVHNATGEVLAYVGNAGLRSSAPYVDGVSAMRQAGSTLKPFLYALALEKRILTPASQLSDTPLKISVMGNMYQPKNYDNRFRGWVSVRTALAGSLNIPAVRTIELVGVESFVTLLNTLGFRNLNEAAFYGPGLALGAADVTLWDLVNAYRTLANGGMWSPLIVAPRHSDPREAGGGRISSRFPGSFGHPWPQDDGGTFSPATAFIISEILSNRESRSVTFGLENSLSTLFVSAVKTGTSKDMRDNWCIGYSSEYTVGVWVGNFSGASMWNVSGLTGAAPIWNEVMHALHRHTSAHPFEPPQGVISHVISKTSQKEWFLTGTEPKKPIRRALPIARITYPTSHMLIALDPDIPTTHQRVFFTATTTKPGWAWQLNGRQLGSAHHPYAWLPKPGSHRLALADGGGRSIDTVTFEVRGSLSE